MSRLVRVALLVPMLVALTFTVSSCSDVCQERYGEDYHEVQDNAMTGRAEYCQDLNGGPDEPHPNFD